MNQSLCNSWFNCPFTNCEDYYEDDESSGESCAEDEQRGQQMPTTKPTTVLKGCDNTQWFVCAKIQNKNSQFSSPN